MGILNNIFRKIFPSSHPAVTQAPAPQGQHSGSKQSASTQPGPTSAERGAMPPPNPAMEMVDVEAILDKMVQPGQTLHWRTSIVDLLKLLHLDSSLQARKDLARELDYSGDTSDTAAMNMWLHRQVMNKLAANGGKVPAELRD